MPRANARVMRPAALLAGALLVPAAVAAQVPPPQSFYTVQPCRLVDTRDPVGPRGGPVLAANTARTFDVTGVCGLPNGVAALALNVTVTQPTAAGNLRTYPNGTPVPGASSINWLPGDTVANWVIAPMGRGGQVPAIIIAVYPDMTSPTGTVHLIIDVNGYFQ
jgi:hypothetical protein